MSNHIKNKVFKGNSIEILKSLPNESVDLIFADPPYFMQTEGMLLRTNGDKFNGVDDHWDKFDSYKEYDEFSEQWLIECKRVLKKNGTIWIIGSFQNIYRIGYIIQNLGFWILNDVVWAKTNPVPNFRGTRFCNANETLLWCAKSQKSKYTFNYKTMKYLNNNKQERSIWNLSLCTGKERLKNKSGQKLHSTQKPEELLYKVILSSTKPNDIVLDPFFGTGTTGVVAKKLGRNYIGIEQEQIYIDSSIERLEKIVSNPSDIEMLSLEISPPKVPIKKLIEKHYLLVNESLFNINGIKICTVMEDGKVCDKEEQLSIHKMSAKHLNKINNNGWTYFYVLRNTELKSINSLRDEYVLNEIGSNDEK